MKLKKINDAYKAGKINKAEYIDAMHEIHKNLFEYAEFIKNTDIAKIEISAELVTMTSKEHGIKMQCDKDDKRVIPIEILNFGDYEKQDTEMILNLINEGDTILDIGANIGWFAINIAKQKKNLQIRAYEPIPKTYKYLINNIKMNAISGITAFNFGFSDVKKDLKFYFNPELTGNTSLENLTQSNKIEEIKCSVKRIDDVIKNNQRVDFIKCDVEGAELFVLKGGIQTIKTSRPIIFAELLRKWTAKFNYNPNDVITLLKDLGYKCYTAYQNHLKEIFLVDEDTLETNFFFLHYDEHLSKIEKYLN
jgi:FkbM family methyltransferase